MTTAKLVRLAAKYKWWIAGAAGLAALLYQRRASAATKPRKIPIEYPFTSYNGFNALYDGGTMTYKACVNDAEYVVPDANCNWAPAQWQF